LIPPTTVFHSYPPALSIRELTSALKYIQIDEHIHHASEMHEPLGRVAGAEEFFRLPGCETIDGSEAVMSDDYTTLTFYCLHREGDECQFKVVLVQDVADGIMCYDVYTPGEHYHGQRRRTVEDKVSLPDDELSEETKHGK